MKSICKNQWFNFFLLILVVSVFSCESDDTQIIQDSSNQSSLGEIQSLEIYSGLNKVMVKGVVEDPNVSEVRFYWNDKSDSVVVPVTNSSEVDTITRIIDNLEEKLQIFSVRTFDDEGNSSKEVTGGAEVFGSNYVDNLENRPVVSNVLKDSLLEVMYSGMDLSTGVIGTEVTYENTAGENKELFIDIDKESFSIPDFESGTTYSYRTVFVPSPMIIDTFYTDYTDFTPVPFPELKNAAVPFEASSTNGRWGILADWNTNEAAKNHDGYGGWDEWNDNIFNMESGWGSPAIVNGKIYQVITAGAASFTLNIEVLDTNHEESDDGGSYFVIAKGDGLPDVEDVETASEVLAYERIVSSTLSYSIDFTVEESTEISIGQIATQWDGTPGRFCNILSFEIVSSE